MRMVCPACSAAYEVPESLLTPGRTVRCARCGHQWAPVAAPEPDTSPPPPAPEPEAPPQPRWPDTEVVEEAELEPLPEEAPRQEPRFTAMDRLTLHQANAKTSPVPLRVAWIGTVLALLLLAAAAYVWRVELMHAWPPSQRLYNALGVTQTPSGKP